MRVLTAPKQATRPASPSLTIHHGPLGPCVLLTPGTDVIADLAGLAYQRFGWHPTSVRLRIRPTLWAYAVTAASPADTKSCRDDEHQLRTRRILSAIAWALTEPSRPGHDPAATLEVDSAHAAASLGSGLIVQVHSTCAPHLEGTELTLTAYAPALEVRS